MPSGARRPLVQNERPSKTLQGYAKRHYPRAAGEALAALVDFVDAILGASDKLPDGLREAAERGAALLPLEDTETTAAALADWWSEATPAGRSRRNLLEDLEHVAALLASERSESTPR